MKEFQRIKDGSMKELETKELILEQKELELTDLSHKISQIYQKIENSKVSKKSDLVNVDELVKEKHK